MNKWLFKPIRLNFIQIVILLSLSIISICIAFYLGLNYVIKTPSQKILLKKKEFSLDQIFVTFPNINEISYEKLNDLKTNFSLIIQVLQENFVNKIINTSLCRLRK
jgi:hypothetical protein